MSECIIPSQPFIANSFAQRNRAMLDLKGMLRRCEISIIYSKCGWLLSGRGCHHHIC